MHKANKKSFHGGFQFAMFFFLATTAIAGAMRRNSFCWNMQIPAEREKVSKNALPLTYSKMR